LHPI
jgi:hypothetical protein